MKKIYANQKVVAPVQSLEDLVMAKPEPGYYKETDDIGHKIPDLLNQVYYQLFFSQSGDFGSFEIEDEQRHNDCIDPVSNRTDSFFT
jgi:hypothetical protein